jgi:hypothetical protein
MDGQAIALLLTIIGMIFSQIGSGLVVTKIGSCLKLKIWCRSSMYHWSRELAMDRVVIIWRPLLSFTFILSILVLIGPSSVRWWLMAVEYCKGRLERDVTMVEWAQDLTYMIPNSSARAKEAMIKGTSIYFSAYHDQYGGEIYWYERYNTEQWA